MSWLLKVEHCVCDFSIASDVAVLLTVTCFSCLSVNHFRCVIKLASAIIVCQQQ